MPQLNAHLTLSPDPSPTSGRGRNAAWPPLPLLTGLLATMALVIAPHALRLPLWLTGFALSMLAWRYLVGRGTLPPPNKWLLLGMALMASIGILLQYHTLFGRDASVALFSLMVALKLLELKNARDAYLSVFLGYFLVLTHFLYSQSLFIAAYLFLIAWLLTTLLIAFSQPRAQLPWPMQLKLSAKLLLQAVPVMLVLFVLFPRMGGPLWGMPQDAFAAKTGLSDSMSPGAISRLAQSDAVAFRVEFTGATPPPAQRYFRVLVLDRFDGSTWYASKTQAMQDTLTPQGQAVRYQLTLEPHDKPWLPAMDFADPMALPPGAQLNQDFSVTQKTALQHRKRYSMSAYPAFGGSAKIDEHELRRATLLPIAGNPRARTLAVKIRQASRNQEDFVNQIFRRFHDQPYIYTLNPPHLTGDTVDAFLFDTQRGFCEHYAGSFAFMMRAAGIPARIVTGYQGGEFNQLGNYFIVRQADAHAWTEVWFADRGWVRIDPTAAVAASRIESGLASALPAGEAIPFFLREPSPWMRQLKFSWDTLNNRWNQWVLGYDQERQISFFSRLGFGIVSWQDLGLYLLVGVGSIIGVLAFFTLRGQRGPTDKVERAYALFCARLARIGITRAANEGPLDFAARASSLRPDLAHAIDTITRPYVALRYGANAQAGWVQEMIVSIARFRPRKSASE